MKKICLLLLCMLSAASCVFAEDDLTKLRDAQKAEVAQLRTEYDARAQAPGADKQALTAEYVQKKQAIRDSFIARDQRMAQLGGLTGQEDLEIISTGGSSKIDPKNVNADVDLTCNSKDPEVLQRAETAVREDFKNRGDYFENESKIVDRTTDTTYWKQETPEGLKAARTDPDAYKTEGGKASVRNPGKVQDELGENLDLESKAAHAAVDGDLKTESKATVKAGSSGATGPKVQGEDGKWRQSDQWKNRSEESRRLYQEADTLKNYGDEVEAGIVELGDDAETAKNKIAEFRRREAAEMDLIKQKAADKSRLRDNIRQDVEDGYRSAADPDVQKVADEVHADRTRVRSTNQDAQDFIDSQRRLPPSEDTYSGGYKGTQPHADAEPGPSGTTRDIDGDVPRTTADADGTPPRSTQPVKDTDAAVPDSPDLSAAAFDTMDGVQLAGEGAKSMQQHFGDAVDNNRDLTAGEVADMAYSSSRIKTVVDTAGGAYSLANQQGTEQATKYQKGEQGLAESIGRAGFDFGAAGRVKDAMVNDVHATASEVIMDNLNQMDDQARRENRPVTMGEGAQFFFGSMAETASHYTGGEAIADFVADTSTWDERSELAGQQAEIRGYVDRTITQDTKNLERITREMEDIIHNRDVDDPANQERMNELMNQYNGNVKHLQDLQGLSDRTLGQSDNVKAQLSQFADPAAFEDYVGDIIDQRRAQTETLPYEEAEGFADDQAQAPDTPIVDEFVDTTGFDDGQGGWSNDASTPTDPFADSQYDISPDGSYGNEFPQPQPDYPVFDDGSQYDFSADGSYGNEYAQPQADYYYEPAAQGNYQPYEPPQEEYYQPYNEPQQDYSYQDNTQQSEQAMNTMQNLANMIGGMVNQVNTNSNYNNNQYQNNSYNSNLMPLGTVPAGGYDQVHSGGYRPANQVRNTNTGGGGGVNLLGQQVSTPVQGSGTHVTDWAPTRRR